jgi:hypothetical protein
VAGANDLEERICPSHSCDDLKLLLYADGAYYGSWVAGQTSVRVILQSCVSLAIIARAHIV